jgi:hypothetical protein
MFDIDQAQIYSVEWGVSGTDRAVGGWIRPEKDN